MCSGKVYYDLLEGRDARGIDDIYLLRVEQFYPFPAQSFVNELKRFPNADYVWCQEEPMNQGAWYAVQHWLRACRLPSQSLTYAGRLSSAAPVASMLPPAMLATCTASAG